MSHQILAGYDGGDGGSEAIDLALALARGAEASHVTVTTVFSPLVAGYHGVLPLPRDDAMRRDASALLEGAMAKYGDRPHTSFRLTRALATAHGLQDLAQELDAAYLTVGQSRHRGLGRMLGGSVTEETINGAPCPVAVAPRGGGPAVDGPPVVGIAYDGSPESTAGLRHAAELSRGLGGELRLVHVVEADTVPHLAYSQTARFQAARAEAQTHLEEVVRQQREAGATNVTSVAVEGPAIEALTRASSELSFLIVGSRGYGPLRRIVLGSVSTSLVRSPTCPVIVLPRSMSSPRAESEPAQSGAHPG